MTSQPVSLTSRRTVLVSAGGAVLALCLGGCAATDSGGAPTSTETTVDVSEVPVGGGLIVGDYVVTQATEGSFAAFSRICTHQSLPVQQVTDAAIVCGHHGSTFALADGAVITGPATEPLPAATVTLSGSTLTIS